MNRSLPLLVAAALMLPVAAHAARTSETTPAAKSGAQKKPPSKAQASSGTALPSMVTFKDPSCGCCTNWVEHMRRHGFKVEVQDRADMAQIKQRLGVPEQKESCHTTQVAGLVIEGHVPARDIARLLLKPGTARGLTAPGMPIGSPGMEMPDGRTAPYTVERINADGTTTPFAEH